MSTNKSHNEFSISLSTIPKLEDNHQNDNSIPIKQNYRNIQIDKETLDDFEDPNICRICFSEKLGVTKNVQLGCGHKFCQKCVSSHITISINNGRVL